MKTPKVSAFIRSYSKDFNWLQYCLDSLAIRGKEFHEIVVAVPANDYEKALEFLELGFADLIGVDTHTNNGYIDQQICKCRAEIYCEGDFIMHFDSDCMATREIELEPFFDGDGLPKLLFRRWGEAGDADAWRLVTRGVLKQEPPFETMPAMPFLYHRSTHELFRRHVAELHGGDFIKYASRLAQFSEFNAMGNFALLCTPDAYKFVRAGKDDGYPRPFKQHWSHAAMREEEMKAILL